MEQPAIAILDSNWIMTIATIRSDAWPQATMVGYANQRLRLYFLISRTSQKFTNIALNPRVAVMVAHEPTEPREIKAIYAGCEAHEVKEAAQRNLAWSLLTTRHPNLSEVAPPDEDDVALMAGDCLHLSVLDYRLAIGHRESFSVA